MENIVKSSQTFDIGFVLRWTARISGVVLLLFWIFFLAREGFPKLSLSTNNENILIICQLLTFLGLGIVWFHELIGGIFSIVGMLAFYLVNFLSTGDIPSSALFLLFYVPGILALMSWRTKRKVA